MKGKSSSLAIEIHSEEMYCCYRSYPLKDNQKIEKSKRENENEERDSLILHSMKAVLVFETDAGVEEEVDRSSCSLAGRETSADP